MDHFFANDPIARHQPLACDDSLNCSDPIAGGNPSSADSHEWSHVKETINMLYLAICQIEATLADSNSSMDTLTHSFTQLANYASDVGRHIEDLTEPQALSAVKEDLATTAAQMKLNINASIRAFQFYDRICQRLDHVARSLEKVSDVMESNSSLGNPQAWRSIQMAIKSSYTMEAEHRMFDSIMSGGTVKSALAVYRQHILKQQTGAQPAANEIELF